MDFEDTENKDPNTYDNFLLVKKDDVPMELTKLEYAGKLGFHGFSVKLQHHTAMVI